MDAEVTAVQCPDRDGDDVSYQIISGNIGGAFAINLVRGLEVFVLDMRFVLVDKWGYFSGSIA